MQYCTKCWMPSGRPRITFKDGVCNACQWSEEKKTINWPWRAKTFRKLCDKFRKKEGCDCIVPWSGGKDSIYVAYKMRGFGMKPLLVTVLPHLETPIGKWNRKNTCTDFEHLEITLDEDKYKKLAKKYFVEQGRPKHPWETAISAVIISKAVELKIPFIIYGEEGEAEYGGASTEKGKWKEPVSKEYLMKYYWQDELDWDIPSDKEFEKIFFTQWSRFENWSPSEHANFAVSKGMRMLDERSIGTFTCHSQLSDSLQDLHAYLMFVKFGFGRCTSDACIAAREGTLTRDAAFRHIVRFDGEFPYKYREDYLKYFDMTNGEFWDVIDGHADKKIVRKSQNPTKPYVLRRPLTAHNLSDMMAYVADSPV